MKNNDLHSVWKNNIVKETKISSKEELNEMIWYGARKAIRPLYRLTLLGFIGGGFMSFLIVTAVRRSEDWGYVIHNMVLLLFIMVGMFLTFYSYCLLYRYKKEQNLKDGLVYRVNALKRTVRYYSIKYYIIPFVVCGAFISVFVPLEDIGFKQIFGNIGFVWSAVLGVSAGIFVVYRSLQKRKIEYQERIRYLDNLYQQFED